MTNTESTDFRPLDRTYKKYGYTFEQVYRRGLVAIYSQVAEESDVVSAYEVFIIKQLPAGEVGPRKYMQPAREVVPSTEEWGRLAFTYHHLDAAMEKFEELQIRINSRK